MKNLFIFALSLATVAVFSCKTNNAGTADAADEFKFAKLTYHLSRCNGSCPSIGLEIDSNKNLYVERQYFKTKSEVDSTHSGQFKGTLSDAQYTQLVNELKKANVDSLVFEEIGITDVPETTIIVHYDGKRKHLHSARPPAAAEALIGVLKAIGNDTTLVRTTETKELERQ